jgi:folylpolyglutamate synthase
VHDVLSQQHTQGFYTRPRYLQLFLLVSLHAFIREGVDAAILETHHGGEYDSTNVIEKPIVTAITPLGMDHVKQLGPSIENIAWHKAGIFKSGAPAFSALQETAASEVLRNRASDKGVSLQFVDNDSSLLAHSPQLKPDVQRTNCSVALAVVRSFLDQKAQENCFSLNSSDINRGISQFSWPGRFQLVVENNLQWFLDGAHNEMSVIKAAEWFIEVSRMQRYRTLLRTLQLALNNFRITSPVVRMLIFSQITDQRDDAAVFERLANSLWGSGVQYVIFTTYKREQDFDSGIGIYIYIASLAFPCAHCVSDRQPSIIEMPSQDVYSEIWKRTEPDTNILFEPTIQGALEIARKIGREHGGMQTLVTGSLHLVGGALGLLQPYVSAQDIPRSDTGPTVQHLRNAIDDNISTS